MSFKAFAESEIKLMSQHCSLPAKFDHLGKNSVVVLAVCDDRYCQSSKVPIPSTPLHHNSFTDENFELDGNLPLY